MDSSDEEYVEDIDESKLTRGSNRWTRSQRTEQSLASGTGSGYRWEDEYQRSWDVVQEDSGGSLATTIAGMVEDTKRKRVLQDTKPVQRGIIRNLVLILDMSSAMDDTDMRPTRLSHILGVASEFITEFFSQNPISQLAIVGVRDGLAQLISPLDGNPEVHIERVLGLKKLTGSGVPSLQNALEMSRALLMHVPSHNTREVLIIYGALMSSDPGSIAKTIDQLVADKIRVKIIGLAAQVAVCQSIAEKTNFGDKSTYSVVLNEQHFKQLVMENTVPLAISSATARSSSVAVKMGFPSRTKHSKVATLCACHSKLTRQGFTCPQCKSKVCTLPMSCPACQLTLVLSTHLARGYHHLFPLANFKQLPPNAASTKNCFGCLAAFENHHNQYQCLSCQNLFCVDCDLFCHDTLHNCPGCEALPS